MGGLLRDQGKLAEAELYYCEAMEKSRRELGREHPITLIITANLGKVLQQQGKHQDTIDLLTPAEDAARKALTGGNPRLAGFFTALGRARVGLGYDVERFKLAEANLLEAHAIFLKSRGEMHKDTLDCVQEIVDLYAAWDTAAPNQGYDTRAADWKAKLAEWRSSTQSATSPQR